MCDVGFGRRWAIEVSEQTNQLEKTPRFGENELDVFSCWWFWEGSARNYKSRLRGSVDGGHSCQLGKAVSKYANLQKEKRKKNQQTDARLIYCRNRRLVALDKIRGGCKCREVTLLPENNPA
jgi:hypothetical protein